MKKYYIIKNQVTQLVNRRKNPTPDNIRMAWSTWDIKFKTLDEARDFANYEQLDVYEIYEVKLVEESAE